MFRTQLRAILRASALGNLQVMFPLISTLLELRQAKMVLADVMEDLDEHGIEFNRNMPVGMMVEVPAAVMMIDRFVEEVDFLSIGTNDLIQYTLAVDRSNKDVVGLYNPADPAVLRLISMAIEAADKKPIPINMCGQMSGNPTYTMLLLGLGLRHFSVTPSRPARDQEHLPPRDHPRVPGGRRPRGRHGKRPRHHELPPRGVETTRARFRERVTCAAVRMPLTAAAHGVCRMQTKQQSFPPLLSWRSRLIRTNGSTASTHSIFKTVGTAPDRPPGPDAVPGAAISPRRAGAGHEPGVSIPSRG